MTSCAQVRSAWDTAIWQHSTVTALTQQIFAFEPNLNSKMELARLRHNQRINFFIYLVTRNQQVRVMNQIQQVFEVTIRRCLYEDVPGVNANQVVTDLETIEGLVVSQLGTTWSGTVDFYNHTNAPVRVRRDRIDGESVMVGEYKYTGFKNI